ncbi:MAG: GNAT family N-acetyltransferase [Bacillota bacterium]
MTQVLNTLQSVNPFYLKKLLKVRKATLQDVDAVFDVACSVGKSEKVAEQGFLVDDYMSNPRYYKTKLKRRIKRLKHFYVAEYDRIYGFLMAYEKNEWLAENPNWMEEVYWRPDFLSSATDNFILVDKTAVLSQLTGMGIGSLMYESLKTDLRNEGIKDIFAETIISPQPNFASLQFRKKQNYNLAGVRYEEYKGKLYTDLIYHKMVD